MNFSYNRYYLSIIKNIYIHNTFSIILDITKYNILFSIDLFKIRLGVLYERKFKKA